MKDYLRKFLNRAEYDATKINCPGVSLIGDTRMVKYDRYPKGFVDLGLPSGNYWAKCNIGAENETDSGWYVAWGELAQKEGWMEDKETHPYNDENYRFYPEIAEGDYEYTKYNSIDGKLVLDPEDDIATVTFGDGYKIPTMEDCFELCDWCCPDYIEDYKDTGINGMIFYRRNLTLPAFKNVTLYSNIFDLERQMYEIDDEIWAEISLFSRDEINSYLISVFGEEFDIVDSMFLDIEGKQLATIDVDYRFSEKETDRNINMFVPFVGYCTESTLRFEERGEYWTSSIVDSESTTDAWRWYMDSYGGIGGSGSSNDRSRGYPIRPIYCAS